MSSLGRVVCAATFLNTKVQFSLLALVRLLSVLGGNRGLKCRNKGPVSCMHALEEHSENTYLYSLDTSEADLHMLQLQDLFQHTACCVLEYRRCPLAWRGCAVHAGPFGLSDRQCLQCVAIRVILSCNLA